MTKKKSIIQSIRQIIVSALLIVTFSANGQGDQCVSAEVVSVGTHIADGPATGLGASGISCGEAVSSPRANADWYIFTPIIEGLYTITSTYDPDQSDTRLKLWEGNEGCSALNCIDGDDDGGTGFTSLLTVCLSAGTTYYIEWDDIWSFSSFTWDLILEDTLSCGPPLNDSCFTATSISIGSSTKGMTLFATDNNPPLCDSVSAASSGGLWFSVVGNGQMLKATTCNPGTEYDTQISVYTGSCSSLTCIVGNDDQAGGLDQLCDVLDISLNVASTVEWLSTAGTLYSIYVNGFEDNSGHFELTVTDIRGPCPTIGTTVFVDNQSDQGQGTLRQVVFDACEGDTVLFDAALSGDTIILSNGEIDINKNLSIIGLGKDILYLSGGNSSGIFKIQPGRVLLLKGMTLMEGYSLSNGGAFYNRGTTRLNDIRLKCNFQGLDLKAFTSENQIIVEEGMVEIRQ